jgi:hypothetical protein
MSRRVYVLSAIVGLSMQATAWAQGEGPVPEPWPPSTRARAPMAPAQEMGRRVGPGVGDDACRPLEMQSNRTRAEVQAEAQERRHTRHQRPDACE